jgi:hypothetical protein
LQGCGRKENKETVAGKNFKRDWNRKTQITDIAVR